ncbi:RNA recognition motif domain-containing protein [Alteromonas sp. CYL-A6]|uniref:RNA recognition motif domain-containing protein n=1 Tax=Alteromonas nitratireducens TaxID=3390813 RepID=UPI0034B4CF98
MKVGLFQCAIVSAVLAVLGYLVFSSISLNAFPPLSVSLSLLVSGIVTPLIASRLGNVTARQTSDHGTDDGEISTLYVGNLPYRANEDAVKSFFSDYIAVQSVRLMKDRKTGKRKGYGFVEVVTNDVDKLINRLNDTVFQDRTLKVRPAKEKAEE